MVEDQSEAAFHLDPLFVAASATIGPGNPPHSRGPQRHDLGDRAVPGWTNVAR
ncbi:hypothetical protein DB32_008372 [Sandaracinus amylolyticus]|uniref:Uncharacterized protein n=1 Tax=Sandaracinus amylolyticus TaxID=927083 RepID=A0A0F6WA13_9BACT|nr:hypothetical protein DB32_008372 [Sandaracinus amylolyticus]